MLGMVKIRIGCIDGLYGSAGNGSDAGGVWGEASLSCRWELQRDGCASGCSVKLLSVLLYADDMVLLNPSREELVVMLQVMDKAAASLGLRINASKTEILSIDKD